MISTWIIEPRDPLIVRDGRPFGPIPGARAASLAFPFPSTTTGGVRTRAGLNSNGIFDTTLIATVKAISVRGPLLVELDDEDDIAEWFAPAPIDALLLDAEPPEKEMVKSVICKRLVPLKLPEHACTDLEDGLALVGMTKSDPRKPYSKAPRFWRWPEFEQWLANPTDEAKKALSQLGHNGPTPENRAHVSIQSLTQTAVEGALFQTRGLEFTRKEKRKRLALAVTAEARINPGLAPLGGERRLVSWRASRKTLPDLLSTLRDGIVKDRACRVVLLTPAHFQRGFLPSWLIEPRHGVSPKLNAVATGRPQVISGWDFEKQIPKPTRRLAPAGTVFFLTLDGDWQAIEHWVDTLWMQCVSDDAPDRCDGFGLAVLGVWSGEFQKME